MIRASTEVHVDQLMRRAQDIELRMSQHFSKREPHVARFLQTRLAKTVEDPEATPTYPTSVSQANTFPIVFLDGGFPTTAGKQTATYTARNVTPQTHVHNLKNRYIAVGTVLIVFELQGTDPELPGHWWCDEGCAAGSGSGSGSGSTSGSVP